MFELSSLARHESKLSCGLAAKFKKFAKWQSSRLS